LCYTCLSRLSFRCWTYVDKFASRFIVIDLRTDLHYSGQPLDFAEKVSSCDSYVVLLLHYCWRIVAFAGLMVASNVVGLLLQRSRLATLEFSSCS